MLTHENNYVKLTGKIMEEFVFSHDCQDICFCTTKVLVRRKSGKEDIVPIIIPRDLIAFKVKDTYVEVEGEIRSFNEKDGDNKKHVKIFVFVKEIRYNQCPRCQYDENFVYFNGFICKPPTLRETPLGTNITDILLAINRTYSISDYVPCIAWNEEAFYASDLKVGTKIQIYGRIQSREYVKMHDDKPTTMVTYEVSISKILV